MGKTRFDFANKRINGFFERYGSKVSTFTDLSKIFSDNKETWNLPNSLGQKEFIELLLEKTNLKKNDFQFPSLKLTRYTWGNVSIFGLIATLRPNSYFSHYSALYLNGLTHQIPKTLYLNFEQPKKHFDRQTLEQENIDRAFSNNQRISNNITDFQEYKICLLNGKFTDNLGVIKLPYSGETISVTNVERTLIDICVRPSYSGGVFEVLRAFKNASSKVSIKKLAAMLRDIDHVYPYHQAIGFYLEKSGAYDDSQIEIFDRFKKEYNFYLTHKMKHPEFSKRWKLFYPKNF